MEKIEDFGEKIGGAKKDLWAANSLSINDVKDMTLREMFKNVVKTNVWKRPDYKKMVDDGMEPGVAYLIKNVYDSIPAKLKPSGDEEEDRKNIEAYIDFVNQVKENVEKVKHEEDLRNLFDRVFIKNGYYTNSNGYREWNKFYPFITHKVIRAINIKNYKILSARNKVIETGFPEKVEAWRKNIIIEEIPTYGWTIAKKRGVSYEIMKDGFSTKEEAEKYLFEVLKPMLSERKKAVKITRPQLKNIERTGPDYRNGKDITTDEFMNTFGFRGGEFGNWTNNLDRQQSLNMAYDAFMDLARILKISPKAISLGGELGIAFGARGSGNALAHYEPTNIVINLTKMKGAGSLAHEWAHALDDFYGRLSKDKCSVQPFITNNLVLATTHLSKETANAWADIIDSIFYKKMTAEESKSEITSKIEGFKKGLKELLNEVRTDFIKDNKASKNDIEKFDEIADSIINKDYDSIRVDKLNDLYKIIVGKNVDKSIINNIKSLAYWTDINRENLKNIQTLNRKVATDYYKDANKIDKTRIKAYWTTKVEMFARAFESYVEDAVKKEGYKSDYLVHGTKADYKEYFPYPKGNEREVFYNRFDKFVSSLKELERGERLEKGEIKRISIEEYNEKISKVTNNVNSKVKDADIIQLENPVQSKKALIKEDKDTPGKWDISISDEENISEVRTNSKQDAVKIAVENGYTEVKDTSKINVKQYGNTSYRDLCEMQDKNFVIRTSEENLKAISNIEVKYCAFKKDNYYNVVIKDYDRIKVMEALKIRDNEVGSTRYETIINSPGENRYLKLSKDEYNLLKNSDVKFAAFQKKDYINAVVKNDDLTKTLRTINRKYEIQEGNTKYSEITKMEGKTCYRIYDNSILETLKKTNIKFAAFDKGNGKYNIAFKENVLDKVNKIANEAKIKNLGKEAER